MTKRRQAALVLTAIPSARARLAHWRLRAENGFLAYGWLVPAFFAPALQGGRAAFHILFYGYILWALLAQRALRAHCSQRCRVVWLALLALLCARLPGNLLAHDVGRAFDQWAVSACYVSVLPVTMMALAQGGEQLPRLLRALGWGACWMLLGAVFNLIWLLSMHGLDFDPRIDMRAVDFGFCLPFGVLLWREKKLFARHRVGTCLLLVLMLCFVFFADERSAMFGFLVALVGVLKVLGVVALWQMAAVFALLAALGLSLTHGMEAFADPSLALLLQMLDQFSSGRLALWQQAIAHPPEQGWFGVGMGNAQYVDAVVQIGALKVRHLHNVWLDAWYEGGWLGVGALVGLLLWALVFIGRSARHWSGARRETAAFVLIAAVAVLVQAQLSISYLSREFNIYIGLCLAVLLHLGAERKNV